MLPEVIAENPRALAVYQQLPEAIVDAKAGFGELTWHRTGPDRRGLPRSQETLLVSSV